MTDDTDTRVRELLKKHDYITKVKKYGDGCVVVYPHPRLVNGYPRLVESFACSRGEKQGLWISTSIDTNGGQERFLDVPEYAMRIFVVCQVSAGNQVIPIDPTMMIFLDENSVEHEDVENILQPPTSEEDRQKETLLYHLIIEARDDGFPPEYQEFAKAHGVLAGYNLLRKLYE